MVVRGSRFNDLAPFRGALQPIRSAYTSSAAGKGAARRKDKGRSKKRMRRAMSAMSGKQDMAGVVEMMGDGKTANFITVAGKAVAAPSGMQAQNFFAGKTDAEPGAAGSAGPRGGGHRRKVTRRDRATTEMACR